MGHPHWRKSVEPVGIGPNLNTVLQATMALRLEDLRQKRLQMKSAWRTLKLENRPLSRFILETQRRAVHNLEKELLLLQMEPKHPQEKRP